MFKLGQNTTRNLETLLQSGKAESHALVYLVKSFIDSTPIDFCVLPTGGYRTAEMQKTIFDNGHSQCDGYDKKSKHQSGLAVDLVPWVGGKATWGVKEAFYLSGAFMAFCRSRGFDNITSGADWNADGDLRDGWDPCHFEIKEL